MTNTTKQKTKTISDIKAKQPKAWKKALAVVFLSLGFFCLLAAMAFWGYEKVYAEKILPGVKIGNYNVGGQAPTEIKESVDALINNLENQKLNLTVNGKTITPTLGEIGVGFNANEIINNAYTVGRQKSLIGRFWEDLKTAVFTKEIVLTPTIDEAKFNNYLSQNTNAIKDAKNATYRIENNQVITVLSETGTKINVDQFYSDLASNIENNNIANPITIKTIAINPEINEDQIFTVKPKIDVLVSTPITLTYDNKSYIAGAETIASWIVIKSLGNGNLDVQLSDDKIKAFIEDVAKKIDKNPVDKKINAQTNEVIEEGSNGLQVDQNRVLSQIKSSLNSFTSTGNRIIAIEVVETPYSEKKIQTSDTEQSGGTPGLYPGKYLEINLSQQKLYAYEGTNLFAAYTVSTGKWDTPTPIGTRYIESKSIKAYSAPYDLYMPYWNSIGGGYGIHELPEWANGYKEGENHLGTPVSHGCIRLGVGAAESIYNWAPVGTPVVIHE
jgi:lipoprotein-anchoring transpeptidase ErfK/SrfK